MSSEHTPGPWRMHLPSNPADRESSLDVGISGIVEGQAKIIVEVFGQVAQHLYPPAEANAHLIAAAPELLLACEALVRWIDDPIVAEAVGDECGIWEAVTAAGIAIAKAREMTA